MSYVNRFLVEEESQFECDGVFELNGIASFMRDVRKINLISSDTQSKLHVVISADLDPIYRYQIISRFQSYIKSTNLMITRIWSERLECVPKEKYEKFYSENGQIQYDPIGYIPARQSIGDAIENFFQAVKMKRIDYNPKTKKSVTFGSLFWRNRHDNIVTNFHLSMLTDEKENEMLIQRNSGRKCHDFKNDTKLSENEHNYALSICFRKTYVKDRNRYYPINDPDSTALTTPRRMQRPRYSYAKEKYLREFPRPRIIEEEKEEKEKAKEEILTDSD